MNSNKLMYFASGDGAEAYTAPVSRLRSIHPVGSTYVDLVFECSEGVRDSADYFDYIRLTITNGTHKQVIKAISQGISQSNVFSPVVVCDNASEEYLNSDIIGCSINLNKSDRNMAGKEIIIVDQDIRYAHTADNTVIVELADIKVPANAIITSVAAIVKTASNLSTHAVNIQMSATSGTAADSSISSGTELLGAGVANTDATDSASASDIDLKNDPKEVWICRDTVRNGTSDQYIYVCNAGTGNGATNSTAGTLSVIIEYYGMD
jgi:hypothetical protein